MVKNVLDYMRNVLDDLSGGAILLNRNVLDDLSGRVIQVNKEHVG